MEVEKMEVEKVSEEEHSEELIAPSEPVRPIHAVGDIVRLRSGGPYMTVQRMTDDIGNNSYGQYSISSHYYECVWFHKGTPRKYLFREETLRS